MSKKRVILDCDGVIVDFVSAYLGLINYHGRTSHVPEDITDWDIVGCLDVPQPVVKKVHEYIDYSFCRDLPPIPGAVEGVKELMKHTEVLFLTSPWGGARGWHTAREEWLQEHLGAKSNQIMHGSAKEWVVADVFVDDKSSMVEKWQAAHPKGLGVLWDQPWGRNSNHPVRTRDWAELLRLVTR